MSKIVHTMGSQVEFSNAYTTAEIEIRERCAALLVLSKGIGFSLVLVDVYLDELEAALGAL